MRILYTLSVLVASIRSCHGFDAASPQFPSCLSFSFSSSSSWSSSSSTSQQGKNARSLIRQQKLRSGGITNVWRRPLTFRISSQAHDDENQFKMEKEDGNDGKDQQQSLSTTPEENERTPSFSLQSLRNWLFRQLDEPNTQNSNSTTTNRPPIQVDDPDLLLYDVFLLVNLSLSISFWVVHRLQLDYLLEALNEGCLLAVCWIIAGLVNGVFLHSALDGHYRITDEKAGPRAAGWLALNTFVGTMNLRLLFALVVAVMQHRPVGGVGGELLMPLELAFGLLLMSAWRVLHSSIVPRI